MEFYVMCTIQRKSNAFLRSVQLWFIYSLAGWFLLSAPLLMAAKQSSIAAGSPSGLYYSLGGTLASIYSHNIPNLTVRAEVTDASVANVIQVAVNESEIGFSQGDVVIDAYYGQGKFDKPLDIVVLFAIYPNIVHILTRASAPINSIHDLKGKVVSVGAPGSGTLVTALKILDTLGIDRNELSIQYLDYIETANAIRDGNIDAGFIVGGIGTAAIIELSLTRPIKMINLTDKEVESIQQRFPAYTPFTIEAGVYKEIESVQALSVWNVFVVNKQMPNELAYQLTKTTFEHLKELRQVSVAADYISVDNAQALANIPLHPGAKKYFDEVSLAGDLIY